MRSLRLVLVVLVCLPLSASLASAGAVQNAATENEPVVASLEPAATAALWSRLVSTRARQQQAPPTDCRPLRSVFYAATDWLRLATKLAERASPCAEYYISIPAIVGNRTQMRRDAAWRVRALGPNFHPMAEFHFTTWSRWVAETGSSWYQAGVLWRQRMAEAGFDVALGDTWVVNELSTAVRRGEGNARANIRELLRGLYEGDGTRPTRGAVLVVGFGQRTNDLSVYQSTLQNWLADTEFWTDMATYVSDWSQEVYGDVRSHAVPGTTTAERREFLNDYLQHKIVLASAGPEEIEPARAYLREAHGALGNAAWERDTGYGWTMVPVELMSAYVSSQVEAMRHFGATSGLPRDRGGFAWAPRNGTGMSAEDFAARTGQILDRMAAAIRDSGTVNSGSPGSRACGPSGQDALCRGDLADARHNEGWRSFRSWTQVALGFVTPAQTIPAGEPSAGIVLALVTRSGARVASAPPREVTVRSSSPQGTFSTSPEGPWASTLATTVAAGPGVTLYYLDTRAGQATLTASAAATTSGTHVVTVNAGPAVVVALAPGPATIPARGQRRLVATARDVYGNAATATLSWRVRPAALGTIAPGDAGTATFTAGRLVRRGTVTVSAGSISASAPVTVTPARLRVGAVAFRPGKRGVRVVLTTVDGARRPVPATAVTLVVRQDGRRVSIGRARTGPAGRAMIRVVTDGGCVTVSVTRAVAQGFRWDGRTPRNRFCRR